MTNTQLIQANIALLIHARGLQVRIVAILLAGGRLALPFAFFGLLPEDRRRNAAILALYRWYRFGSLDRTAAEEA